MLPFRLVVLVVIWTLLGFLYEFGSAVDFCKKGSWDLVVIALESSLVTFGEVTNRNIYHLLILKYLLPFDR